MHVFLNRNFNSKNGIRMYYYYSWKETDCNDSVETSLYGREEHIPEDYSLLKRAGVKLYKYSLTTDKPSNSLHQDQVNGLASLENALNNCLGNLSQLIVWKLFAYSNLHVIVISNEFKSIFLNKVKYKWLDYVIVVFNKSQLGIILA